MRAVPTPRVDLPAALLADLRAEAQRALPRECCGLLEGVRAEDAFTIHALHPACNLSQDADCFEIDPRDHFATVRKVRGKGAAIIGCYHSHPNGKAYFSKEDEARAKMWDEPIYPEAVYIVLGVDGHAVTGISEIGRAHV